MNEFIAPIIAEPSGLPSTEITAHSLPNTFDYHALQSGLEALVAAYTQQERASHTSGLTVAALAEPFLTLDPAPLNRFTRHHATPTVAAWQAAKQPLPLASFHEKLKLLSVSLEPPGANDPLHMKGVDLLWLLGSLGERALDADDPLKLSPEHRAELKKLDRMLVAQEAWLRPGSDHAKAVLHGVLGRHDLSPSGYSHPHVAELIQGMKMLQKHGALEDLGKFAQSPLPLEKVDSWRSQIRYGEYAQNGFPLRHSWRGEEPSAHALLEHMRDVLLPKLAGQADWAAVKAHAAPLRKHHLLDDMAPTSDIPVDAASPKEAMHDLEEAVHDGVLIDPHSEYIASLHPKLETARDYQALHCFAQALQTVAARLPRTGHAHVAAMENLREHLFEIAGLARHLVGLAPDIDVLPQGGEEMQRLWNGDTGMLGETHSVALGARAYAELDAWSRALSVPAKGR